MKIWLWIIGIVLFIASIIIGALQHSEVQYQIGEYYSVKGDDEQAYKWFFKSAKHGHKESREVMMMYGAYMEDIGLLYGVMWLLEDRNIFNEFKNYKKKPLGDDARMIFILGVSYYFGANNKLDKALGCAYFRVAGEAIFYFEDYHFKIDEIVQMAELEMTPEEIAESKVMAKEILEKIIANQKVTAP